jgi:hypothetical protein
VRPLPYCLCERSNLDLYLKLYYLDLVISEWKVEHNILTLSLCTETRHRHATESAMWTHQHSAKENDTMWCTLSLSAVDNCANNDNDIIARNPRQSRDRTRGQRSHVESEQRGLISGVVNKGIVLTIVTIITSISNSISAQHLDDWLMSGSS